LQRNRKSWSHLTGRVHTRLTEKEIAKKHGVSENIAKCIKLGETHSFVTEHFIGVKPTKPTTLYDFFEKGSI